MAARKRRMRSTRRIREAAREMRAAPTPAEALFWEAVRDRKLGGLKFRRQFAIGRCVLDFYCPEVHLAVELDGSVHEERQEYDHERTKELEGHGIRVVRFRNREVLTNLSGVLECLSQEARRSAQREVPPLPLAGEGARG